MAVSTRSQASATDPTVQTNRTVSIFCISQWVLYLYTFFLVYTYIYIYLYEGCSKFFHAEKDIFAEKKKFFRQTFAISMFNFSGTSGEYRTGPRTNEPP